MIFILDFVDRPHLIVGSKLAIPYADLTLFQRRMTTTGGEEVYTSPGRRGGTSPNLLDAVVAGWGWVDFDMTTKTMWIKLTRTTGGEERWAALSWGKPIFVGCLCGRGGGWIST